jgi:hypothetical protein
MKNMLIEPTPEELNTDFGGEPDIQIFNAGEM